MIKSAFIGALFGTLAFHVLDALICKIHNSFICNDEESFWENRRFEDSLEKADDLCENGYTFQRNEVIFKKISGKKWFAEILIPDDDQFEIGCELTIKNYIYKKIGERVSIELIYILIYHAKI